MVEPPIDFPTLRSGSKGQKRESPLRPIFSNGCRNYAVTFGPGYHKVTNFAQITNECTFVRWAEVSLLQRASELRRRLSRPRVVQRCASSNYHQ
jgi:hypothetical protein